MRATSETNPLRVGLMIDDSLDGHHGVGTYVKDLGRWLTQEGHEVHYIAGPTNEPVSEGTLHSLTPGNYEVGINGNRLTVPKPVSRRSAQDFLAETELDVLHVQMPYAPWYAGKLIAAAEQERLVGTFHILPFGRKERLGSWVVGRAQQSTLRRFDASVAPSPAAQEFARWAYKIKADVVPNPVNFSFYNEYPSPEEPDDEYVDIVFVGRLVERKGAQHLIALMQEGLLNCNEKKVRLTIAGAGPMEDELRKQAAHITYPGYEVMFLGSISDEDKASLFKSSDLAVFPATGGESFGIILLEAMSAGRPIVFGGNNPGYEHVLTSDHPRPDAPVSFDPANLGHMSTIINAYIDNETLRSQVRLAQTDKARKHDISVIGRQLMKRYLA